MNFNEIIFYRLAYKSKLKERHLKYNKIIQEIPSREKYSRYIIGFLLCTLVVITSQIRMLYHLILKIHCSWFL